MNQDFIQPNLTGKTVTLSPLILGDFESLYEAISDPLIWENHPSRNRYKREEYTKWFDAAIASKGALVVREIDSGKIIGSSRYYEFNESLSEVSIGYTFLVRAHWGGATNSELKKLMLNHAFQKVKTVWFHVDVRNIRSQKAMAKIGAVFSHSGQKELSGAVENYCFYKIESRHFD